jgi:quercetin dioxygenase-like cupin family protein
MQPKAFALTPEQYARPLNVVGEKITVLASKNATGGGYEIFLQDGPAGSGPPPHSHGWDEAFFVLSGEIEFGFDDKKMTARPGTLVHLPAGTVHWFRFGAQGGRMLSLTSTGNASELFTGIDQAIAPNAPDLAKLVEVAKRTGVTINV